ncbi:MAG: hypothetical protein M1832_003726 [Thelocarpon impressellum]|nr:MAG: hypothetical protein M1832_003726 [Thelocarpon impressellum]
MRSAVLTSLTCFAAAVLGHMQLLHPPPFGAENNPHRTDPADERLQYPYNCCGRTTPFPCGGYLKLLGTAQGQSVASWPAGSVQNWNITGIGNHYGGSCQVGFSVDKGETFQVATSYEGNCPHRTAGGGPEGQNFDFTVPADMPTGDVVFAWTWFNREQEFNMNCAAVTITGASGQPEGEAKGVVDGPAPSQVDQSSTAAATTYSSNGCACTCDKPLSPRALQHHRRAGGVAVSGHKAKRDSVSYDQRPGMMLAEPDSGCTVPHTTAELKYPNPGPDVVHGDGMYPVEMPTPPDKCGY